MGLEIGATVAYAVTASTATSMTLAGTIIAGAINGAIIGAAIGGLTAAVTGGDIGKGLLYGAVGGLVTGGITAGLTYTPTPATGIAPSGGGVLSGNVPTPTGAELAFGVGDAVTVTTPVSELGASLQPTGVLDIIKQDVLSPDNLIKMGTEGIKSGVGGILESNAISDAAETKADSDKEITAMKIAGEKDLLNTKIDADREIRQEDILPLAWKIK